MHEASASTTVVLTCTSAPDMRRMNWAVVKEEVVRADSGRGLPGSSESSTTTVFQGGLIYPYGHFFTQERGILLKTKKKKECSEWNSRDRIGGDLGARREDATGILSPEPATSPRGPPISDGTYPIKARERIAKEYESKSRGGEKAPKHTEACQPACLQVELPVKVPEYLWVTRPVVDQVVGQQ
jgi:hypothetical protein